MTLSACARARSVFKHEETPAQLLLRVCHGDTHGQAECCLTRSAYFWVRRCLDKYRNSSCTVPTSASNEFCNTISKHAHSHQRSSGALPSWCHHVQQVLPTACATHLTTPLVVHVSRVFRQRDGALGNARRCVERRAQPGHSHSHCPGDMHIRAHADAARRCRGHATEGNRTCPPGPRLSPGTSCHPRTRRLPVAHPALEWTSQRTTRTT